MFGIIYKKVGTRGWGMAPCKSASAQARGPKFVPQHPCITEVDTLNHGIRMMVRLIKQVALGCDVSLWGSKWAVCLTVINMI